MELVYLYIKEYRNLKEMEFNFCSDLCFSYDADKCCLQEIPVSNKLPDNFWGDNISNLTMIVGNNGAGKTSVMQFIIDTFSFIHEGRNLSSDGILVLKDGNHLYYTVLGEMYAEVNLEKKNIM